MTKTSHKWLIGCGAGCGLVVVVVAALIAGAALYIRDKFHVVREAGDSRKQLVSAYGEAEAFVPPGDGAITPERMAAFLSVRYSLEDAQARVDAAFADFPTELLKRRRQSFGTALEMLRGVSALITPIGEYVNRRNRALLDKRMGLGEYAYIYSVAYYSWLGHSPEDGPRVLSEAGEPERDRLLSADSTFGPDNLRRYYRRLTLRLLENQAANLRGDERAKWGPALKEEIDRIERNLGTIAWQDNVPLQIDRSLEPYRSRLEATYHSSTNCFELLTTGESGRFEWRY
jgi:hypothetical protein